MRALHEPGGPAIDLSGRVAIVTGAAQGQGAAEARHFCDLGATVVIVELLGAETHVITHTETGSTIIVRQSASAAKPKIGEGVRIAVDPATGASAIVIDREGNVLRVRAEDALSLTGLLDGTVLFDSRVEIAAVPPRREGLRNVAFLLDSHEIASRTTAP